MNEIVVPCLGMWELAESLPDAIVRPERPMNLKPWTPAEIEEFSLDDRNHRKTWGAIVAPLICKTCVKFIREECLDDRQFSEGS